MSRLSVIAAILLLSSVGGAATSSDGCLENLIACEDACCTGAGGQPSGEGCLTDTDAQSNAFFSCDEACGSAAIRCISPNSGCDSQFRSCAQACTGSGQERQDCFESCSFAGIMCADEASESGSGSGGCCGSGAVLVFGAAGALLFAGRA